MSLDRVPTGRNVPDDINVIIEIPAHGEPIKYEVDKETGAMFVDRFMSTAMHYPCNWLPFWIIWSKCSKRKSLICWLYIKPVLANLNIIC